MGAGRNKALLELAGRPLLLHSLETFRACCERLVILAAEGDLDETRRLAPGIDVVVGGATRHGSEWNGLRHLGPGVAVDAVVALHDVARPLVTPDDVARVFDAADQHGAAMLAQPASLPALEVVDGRVSRAYDPATLWRAQTPQAARFGSLLDAYGRAAAAGFEGTDTAAVLAYAGYSVRLVPAGADNPKLTVPGDLAQAEAILARRGGRGNASAEG